MIGRWICKIWKWNYVSSSSNKNTHAKIFYHLETGIVDTDILLLIDI